MLDGNEEIDALSQGIPFVRPLDKKMGMALARRTVFRELDKQDWGRVATRVALGNTELVDSGKEDFEDLRNRIASGEILMSGRHLQHGDADQKNRNMEIHTNCATAATSFLLFYLLLNGSGVGRSYDDKMIVVNWDNAPQLINVCDPAHADYSADAFYTGPDLSRLEGSIYFTVPDSREGWAQALEKYETLAFQGSSSKVLILDWSRVRPKGALIGGMQDRPASGPVPTAEAFNKVATNVVGKGYPLWQQAMMVDHYMAECVLVGGARRSARMATKHWADPGAKAFATFKQDYRDEFGYPIFYSSNNSIITDPEFWSQENPWAKEVLTAALTTAYYDGTGEPGFINVYNFAPDDIDFTIYEDGRFADSFKYTVSDSGADYLKDIVKAFKSMLYQMITNPCGEIALILIGGYCVIADVVPFHSRNANEVELSFRAATRALIRVNTMRSLYQREVTRTNRIGVSFTGIHEYAWQEFGLGFYDMLDEFGRAKYFWAAMSRFSRAVKDEACKYSAKLGLPTPVTDTTVKPAGSTSKLFALTEGAHLPSMREYLRWMQFRTGDPIVEYYRERGYPVKELTSYSGTTIVGFPTQPTICKLGMPTGTLVTAAEATPDEQFKYLQLLEKYWINGVDEAGELLPNTGNQVSYTLKYDPKIETFESFKEIILKYQPTVRCCSVMPQADMTAYEYQPEEPFKTVGEFKAVIAAINDPEALEDIDMSHLQCQSGACPL